MTVTDETTQQSAPAATLESPAVDISEESGVVPVKRQPDSITEIEGSGVVPVKRQPASVPVTEESVVPVKRQPDFISATKESGLAPIKWQPNSIQAIEESYIMPVWLNVYDIDAFTGRLNTALLRDANLGAFHCGVQVLGGELFFAWGETEHTGIIWTEPRSHQVHVYRESISMGESPLSEAEIRTVIAHAMDAWPANSYHPLTRNCVTFAEELIKTLQVPEPCPSWIRGAVDAGNVPWLKPVADCGWSWVKWWCTTTPPQDQQQA